MDAQAIAALFRALGLGAPTAPPTPEAIRLGEAEVLKALDALGRYEGNTRRLAGWL